MYFQTWKLFSLAEINSCPDGENVSDERVLQ